MGAWDSVASPLGATSSQPGNTYLAQQMGSMFGQTNATPQANSMAQQVGNAFGPTQGQTPDGQTYELKQQTNWGDNPWGSQLGADTNRGMGIAQNANQNIGTLQGQLQQLQGNPSNYPAMPNGFGLGLQQPSIPQNYASSPGFMSQPLNTTMPDSGSRGFNPWSLQGESNARGK